MSTLSLNLRFSYSQHQLLSLFLMLIVSVSISSAQPLCPSEDRSALLEFNRTFSIQKFASRDPSAYPKVTLWIDTNCCFWYGVDCDEDTGHVNGLDLSSSYLFGPFTSGNSLFRLVRLKRLNLADNHFNFSQIPSRIGDLSGLNLLNLSGSSFSGKIPSEISQLSNLTTLDLSQNLNDTSGYMLHINKSDFYRIVQNMTSLQVLDLGLVSIPSTLPQSLGNLSSLTYLNLLGSNLYGDIPTSLWNLSKLSYLNLKDNNFSGSLQLSPGILQKVSFLSLENNKFSGPVPPWLANLTQLGYLSLSNNSFSPGDLSWIGNQNKLNELWLNNMALAGEIPSSLCGFTRLRKLDLSYNNLTGQIPGCLSNLTQLLTLDLRSNLLGGFQKLDVLSHLPGLQFFSVTNNKIQGPLPIVPPSLLDYCADGNSLMGEISPSFCDLSLLVYIDLSRNTLSGPIPPCLGNLKSSLLVLSLAQNNFSGEIPGTFGNLSSLKLLDLSRNQLTGQVPRSLSGCQMLQVAVLSENSIGGPFPYWLGDLPKLEVLILRSNKFDGEINNITPTSMSSKLRVLDISINNFTGDLPEKIFSKLFSMKYIDKDQLAYLGINHSKDMDDGLVYSNYQSQMVLANKGVYIRYWKIPNVIAALDVSSNKFHGQIPESICALKMVNLLNISNNQLSGQIPPALANLSALESLDLSNNKLSGDIPMQLRELNYLAYLNVSHNQLEGRIPQGSQFDTFDESSYYGNLGLCGKPLTKVCEASETPPASSPGGSNLSIKWEAVFTGFGCGLVVGLVIGFRFLRTIWFVQIIESRKKRTRKR